MKIKDVLLNGIKILKDNDIEDSNMKAKIILADLLGKNKEYLISHDEEEIEDGLNRIFQEKIERLKNYEPLQYIINKQEFMGFEFYVDENVLIPQPDTENLVEEVILLSDKSRKNLKEELRILDLCTGSGAIAISISKLIKKCLVYASDISKEALNIAEENSTRNAANVLFFESDLFEKISSLYKFDIIVSNPPYIEKNMIETLSEEVKKEPILALDGGEDGLDFYRRIAKDAKKYLNVNGYLAFEIGYNQKLAVKQILKENGYKNIYSRKDLGGNDRIVVGQI
ncbi:MAG: peptide chain release factor N(5)-glutamine methyltransferase [Clostridia bacterium]|nr:peptide chain release factor N(5)-glutamine methyltransferase [Clostridia bacterium]